MNVAFVVDQSGSMDGEQSRVRGFVENLANQLNLVDFGPQAGVVFFAITEEEPDALDAWAALGVTMDALGQGEIARTCQQEVLRIKMSA